VGVGVLWGTLITHELRATFAAMIVVKVLLQRAERGVQSYVGAWLAAGTADPGTTLAAAPRETPSSTLPIAVPAAALLCSRDHSGQAVCVACDAIRCLWVRPQCGACRGDTGRQGCGQPVAHGHLYLWRTVGVWSVRLRVHLVVHSGQVMCGVNCWHRMENYRR